MVNEQAEILWMSQWDEEFGDGWAKPIWKTKHPEQFYKQRRKYTPGENNSFLFLLTVLPNERTVKQYEDSKFSNL